MADVALALALPVSVKPPTVAAIPGKADVTAGKAAPFAIVMAAANDPLAALKAAAKGGTIAPDATVTDDLTVSEKPQDEASSDDGDDCAANPDALLSLLTTPASTPQLIAQAPVQAQASAQQTATPQVVSASALQGQADAALASRATPVIRMTTPETVAQHMLPGAPALSTPHATTPQAATESQIPQVVASAPQEPQPTTLTSVSALVAMMTQPDAAAQALPQAAPSAARPAALPDVTQLQAAAPQLAAAIAVASKTDAPASQEVAPVATPESGDEAAGAIPAAIPTQAAVVPVAAVPSPALVRNVRTIAPRIGDTARAAPSQRADAVKTQISQNRVADRVPQDHAAADRGDSAGVAAVMAHQSQQQDAAPAAVSSAASALADAGSIEAMTARHLDLAKGNQWLDGLTRDIVATGNGSSNLSFTLQPEHLGALKVDILKGDDGATVNMTTDNDRARAIIQDAQPRLVAEARAQGLTLKETNVSTNGDPSSQQRQAQNQGTAQQSTGQQQPGQDRRAFAQGASSESRRPSRPSASEQRTDSDLYA